MNLTQIILDQPSEPSSPSPEPLPEAQILTLREMLAAHRREWRVGDLVQLRGGISSRIEGRPMIVLEVVDMPRCVDPGTIGSTRYGSLETIRIIVHMDDGWRAMLWEPWQLIDWDGPLPEKEEAPPSTQDGHRIVRIGERFLAADGVGMERHTFFGLEDQIVGRPGEVVEEFLNLGDRVLRRVLRVRDGVETVVAEWVLPS